MDVHRGESTQKLFNGSYLSSPLSKTVEFRAVCQNNIDNLITKIQTELINRNYLKFSSYVSELIASSHQQMPSSPTHQRHLNPTKQKTQQFRTSTGRSKVPHQTTQTITSLDYENMDTQISEKLLNSSSKNGKQGASGTGDRALLQTEENQVVEKLMTTKIDTKKRTESNQSQCSLMEEQQQPQTLLETCFDILFQEEDEQYVVFLI